MSRTEELNARVVAALDGALRGEPDDLVELLLNFIPRWSKDEADDVLRESYFEIKRKLIDGATVVRLAPQVSGIVRRCAVRIIKGDRNNKSVSALLPNKQEELLDSPDSSYDPAVFLERLEKFTDMKRAIELRREKNPRHLATLAYEFRQIDAAGRESPYGDADVKPATRRKRRERACDAAMEELKAIRKDTSL